MYRNNMRIAVQDAEFNQELLAEGLIITIGKRKNKVDFETLDLMIWREQDELKINEYTTKEDVEKFLEPMGLGEWVVQHIMDLVKHYYTTDKPNRSKKSSTQYYHLFE